MRLKYRILHQIICTSKCIIMHFSRDRTVSLSSAFRSRTCNHPFRKLHEKEIQHADEKRICISAHRAWIFSDPRMVVGLEKSYKLYRPSFDFDCACNVRRGT